MPLTALPKTAPTTAPLALPITPPITPPTTLPRRRAAARTLLTLLVITAGVGPAGAAGPAPAPGKAGTAAVTKAAAKPAPTAKTAAAPRAKPATPRQQLKSEAEGLALATATVETISEAQLNVAMRVLTGAADCEFNERVTVVPVDGQPGHFHVGHKGLRYTMVPEETTTGAVRLVDRRAGMVWLQIPVKSMLMNSKQGRRMVDACTHAEQRAAMTAVTVAGTGLGIVPSAAPAPAASSAVDGTVVSAVVVEPAATPATPNPVVTEPVPTPTSPGAVAAEPAAAPASAPR